MYIQPDNHPAIQQLIKWAKSTGDRGMRRAAADKSDYDWNVPFVSFTALEDYFGQPHVVDNLLRALFNKDELELESLHADQIKRNYSRVFCLLIIIGHGRFINEFVKHNIHDKRLPLLPHEQNIFPITTSDSSFFDKFCQEQWQFCVPKLHNADIVRGFDHPETILPIRRKRTLGEGGSATVYEIEVHESYNRLDVVGLPYLASKNAPHAGSHGSGRPHPSTFVLKAYHNTQDARRYYDNEWRALKRIHSKQPNPHVVGFHGCFILGGIYNILLEYADKGTLEEYLSTTKPPHTDQDIFNFWQSILSVTKGLLSIHNSRQSSEGPQMVQGWHQDIKPTNILIKSRKGGSGYDFECKLADLGLSHFKRSQSWRADSTDTDAHGTRTYGAPECFRYDDTIENEPLLIKQHVDIWSLGCVLSEVATWVACDWDTVLEYRIQRRKDIERMHIFRDGEDFFHNGQDDLLDAVRNNHAHLVNSVRHCDHVTGSVIKMIKDDMLTKSDTEARRTALDIVNESAKILKKAEGGVFKTPHLSSSSESPRQADTLGHTSEDILVPPEPPRGTDPLNFDPPIQPSDPSIIAQSHLSDYNFFDSNNNRSSSDSRQQLARLLRSPPGVPTEHTRGEIGLQRTTSLAERAMILPKHLAAGTLNNGPNCLTNGQPSNGSPFREPHEHLHRRRFTSPLSQARGNGTAQNSTMSGTSSVVQPSRPSTPPSSSAVLNLITLESLLRHHPRTESSLDRQSPPFWSVEDALNWKRAEKDPKNHEKNPRPNERYMEGLNDRDHAFLVDNASSMLAHETQVRSLLELLGYLVKRKDPNGVDLYFTCSSKKYSNIRKATRLIELFNRHRPRGNEDKTDMSARLSSIMIEYQNDLARRHHLGLRKTRPLSLYILTDAVWQPVCEVAPVIKSFVNTLTERNLPKQKVGIQFIRFGNHPHKSRLKELDRLKVDGHVDLDIVDTEPADGNVLKMLLGAINDWFDDDAPSNSALPGTPSTPTPTSGNRFSTPAQSPGHRIPTSNHYSPG